MKTAIFKRKNGQVLCDHVMSYKTDPAFKKVINYMESRKQLGMKLSIPFKLTADAYSIEIDGPIDPCDKEYGVDGKVVLHDI